VYACVYACVCACVWLHECIACVYMYVCVLLMRDICVLYGGLCVWVCVYVVRVYVRLCTSVCVCMRVHVTGGCKCVTDVRTYVYYVVDVSIRVHMCVTSMYTHQCTHRQ
jgi:hypothetical protein